MISNLFRFLFLLPAFYWVYLIFFGQLGADPAKNLLHKTGEIVLYYILFNILIGILISWKVRFHPRLRFLLLHRRFIGVFSFFVLLFHVFLYFAMEAFEFKAVEQLYTKTYLIFASLAFIILFVLAITSNDFSVKKLSFKKWKLLHRTVYLASWFFSIHIILIEKADLVKYGFILGILWLLQAVRLVRYLLAKKRSSLE